MSSQPPASAKKDIFYLFRSLNSRNYRLFFMGQSVSLIGTWMTNVAMLWLVWRLTDSALILGVVSFASRVPTFLLAPFAGVWIDRLNRHRVLVVTQAMAMLQSFALAILAFSPLESEMKIPLLVALCICQGAINAFDMPTRQSFVVEMVKDKRDLGNAIALNSSMANLSRVIGPSVAGLIVAVVGEGWCFFIDGFSYFAVLCSLLLMRMPPREAPSHKKKSLAELQDGWRYVVGFMPIRTLLLLLCTVSLVGMPYQSMLPAFVGSVLKGNSSAYGFLLGAAAVGALAGAMSLASRSSVLGLGRQIPITTAVFGLSLMLFSATHSLWFSLPLMVVVGFGSIQTMASCNTLLQTIIEDDKRGRVMSFHTMSAVGMMSFGGLLTGVLSHYVGISWCLCICGACLLASAGWFYRSLPRMRNEVRPIYREKGILPRENLSTDKACASSGRF